MNFKLNSFKVLVSSIPEFCTSHWLLRMPLVIIFLQQGLMKVPFDLDEASSYGLPPLVWWIVIAGELGAGLGLLLGGFFDHIHLLHTQRTYYVYTPSGLA